MHKKTTEQWILESSIIHNNKFNYDKSIYTGKENKIIITCPIHGDFDQKAGSHIRGIGCSKCSGKHKYTTEEWINLASKYHNNKYDYSLVNYIGAKTNVKIICPIHGEFKQTPDRHLNSCGCLQCSIIQNGLNSRKTLEEFIKQVETKHNHKYNYDKVKYITDREKVIITCPIHGDFPQRPDNHLQGQGCPTCSLPKGELLINRWLTENHIKFKTQLEVQMDEIARNTNLVVIDFFVVNKCKQYFIEYDGKQHFEYIPFFHSGGLIDFEKELNRDIVLEKYCEKHKDKVTLIRFKYDLLDEQIINQLNEIFL